MGRLKVVFEKSAEAKLPTFGELSPGDVFLHDGDVCIKLKSWGEDPNVAWRNEEDGNWVAIRFENEVEVEPVEAELRIGKPAAHAEAEEAKPLTFGDLAVGELFRFLGPEDDEHPCLVEGMIGYNMVKTNAELCNGGRYGRTWMATDRWLVERV